MRYVAIDFETGNSSPLSACSLGVSVFEGKALVREETSLIRPPECAGKFHWGNIRINHITEKMVEGAPDFYSVWKPFETEAEGSVLVCHNASFDINILCACLAHYHMKTPECRYVCTVKTARRVWPELENHRLNTVSHALGIELNHHEAGSDARASGLILQAAMRATHTPDAEALAEKIGMRLGRISSMGVTPCSIARGARDNFEAVIL